MWRKLTSPFTEFGFAAAALYAADRVICRISPRLGLFVYELMVQPSTGTPLLPANLAKNLTFAVIGRGHPDIELMPEHRMGIGFMAIWHGANAYLHFSRRTLHLQPHDAL